jgi:cell division FtsZ-interacting protein ZapD
MEMLRPHFEKPLAEVAELFGICRTSLKKICRKQGIARWPHRHILALRKSIKSMENAMEHFTGEERLSFAKQLDRQREHLATMLEIPRTNIGSAASTPLKSLASARSSSDSSVQSNKENRYVTIQLQPIALKNAQVLQQNRNTALVLPKEYSNQHQLQQQQQSKQLTNQCANTPLYHGLGTSHKSHSHDQSHAHHWLSSSTYRPNPCEMKQPILRLPPITFLLHGKKA